MERRKILWLVSWYPNKKDKFDGDFIQRHARAAAVYHDIHVVFVTDAAGKIPVEEDRLEADGLTEQIIYFRGYSGVVGRLFKQWKWRKLYRQAVAAYIREKGKPALVHVQVPWKAGLIALWVKKKYKVPYIITEHYGIYNRARPDNFSTWSVLAKNLMKRIYSRAEGLVSVSEYLATGMQKYLGEKKYLIIPNVVDTALFFPSKEKHPCFTFIHVSNMVPLKNVTGILKAFKALTERTAGTDLQLILIGNRNEEYIIQARELGLLETSVHFKSEIPYSQVASEMQKAHCLILNSNIENSPCVIGEALCCGLPVIATRVGGVPELVNDTNSILIPPQNTGALTEAMFAIWQNIGHYNAAEISSAAAARFCYAAISEQFAHLYYSWKKGIDC